MLEIARLLIVRLSAVRIVIRGDPLSNVTAVTVPVSVVAPAVVTCEPAGQRLHSLLPTAAAKLPGAQATQAV